MIAPRTDRAHGIACPQCGTRTSVVETRARGTTRLYRRRKCPQCGTRCTTEETIITAPHPVGPGVRFAARPALAAEAATPEGA